MSCSQRVSESEFLSRYAQRFGKKPLLSLAVAITESSLCADAVGPDGKDCGIMQVRLPTAQWLTGNETLSCEQLKNPAFGASLGIQYLNYWLDRTKGNVRDAVSAYNAGHPTMFNQFYVFKVMGHYKRLLKKYGIKEAQDIKGINLAPIGYGDVTVTGRVPPAIDPSLFHIGGDFTGFYIKLAILVLVGFIVLSFVLRFV